MQINTEDDLRKVVNILHDAEFTDDDFGLDEQKRAFHIELRHPEKHKKIFRLTLFNVEEYRPIHLDKIRAGKALGGVFNTIRIRNNGQDLELISQDLQIRVKMSKLAGLLDESE